MSRLERYLLKDRLHVPFSGSLKAVESSTRPVIEESDLDSDEVVQLYERGAIFPIETAEPYRGGVNFYTEHDMFPRPTDPDDL